MLTDNSGATDMTPDIPDSHEETGFDLPDIPDFPDDFNTDDINRPSVHDFGSVTDNGRR